MPPDRLVVDELGPEIDAVTSGETVASASEPAPVTATTPPSNAFPSVLAVAPVAALATSEIGPWAVTLESLKDATTRGTSSIVDFGLSVNANDSTPTLAAVASTVAV